MFIFLGGGMTYVNGNIFVGLGRPDIVCPATSSDMGPQLSSTPRGKIWKVDLQSGSAVEWSIGIKVRQKRDHPIIFYNF